MKAPYFLLILFFIAQLMFSCGSEEKKVENKTVKDTSKVDELKKLNSQIAASPNNSSLYHDRSLYYLNHGVYSRAMDDVERALKLDSANAEYHFTKGDIFFSLMRFDEATINFAKCIQLDKEHVNANLKMARILLYMRQFDDCLNHIDVALKANVNLAEAYFLKGMVFQYAGDSAKAASSFQTAVEQKADYYDAYITLGLLYANKKDSLAIQYYQSALSLRHNSAEAWYNLGMYYQENGKYKEALNAYDNMIKTNPNAEMAYYNKGYVYLIYLGEYQNAISRFDSALHINPRYRDAYHNRGLAYRELQKYPQARADFRTALQLDPQFELSANELDDMDRKKLK